MKRGLVYFCLQAEKERYAKLDASVTGRNAETVYRDRKSGKRVDAEELAALEQAEKKPKSETPVWGGGIAQVSCTITACEKCTSEQWRELQ